MKKNSVNNFKETPQKKSSFILQNKESPFDEGSKNFKRYSEKDLQMLINKMKGISCKKIISETSSPFKAKKEISPKKSINETNSINDTRIKKGDMMLENLQFLSSGQSFYLNSKINFSTIKNTLNQRIIDQTKIVKVSKGGPFLSCSAFYTIAGNPTIENQDRITALINIKRPKYSVEPVWPNCSLFCLYDGHNGSST